MVVALSPKVTLFFPSSCFLCFLDTGGPPIHLLLPLIVVPLLLLIVAVGFHYRRKIIKQR